MDKKIAENWLTTLNGVQSILRLIADHEKNMNEQDVENLCFLAHDSLAQLGEQMFDFVEDGSNND